MTVVAFKAVKPRALNIYAVNDALSARGWHLNALQLPPALHMCFTAQHASIVKSLLKVRRPLLGSVCELVGYSLFNDQTSKVIILWMRIAMQHAAVASPCQRHACQFLEVHVSLLGTCFYTIRGTK